MAIVHTAPVAPIEPPAVDSALVEAPATDDAPPAKATKAPKEKKAVTKKPSLHPTYLEMIREAIGSLKERTGSSQYAISKFVEDKHKDHLPANFKKLLLVQLRKLTAAGKLTKVKNSYKISEKLKPKSAAVKAKPKASAAKPKAKPKSSTAKPKAKSAAVKPKTAAKSKSVAPEPKASSGLAKAAKTSVKATPAKLTTAAPVAAKKPKAVKKAPAVKKAEK